MSFDANQYVDCIEIAKIKLCELRYLYLYSLLSEEEGHYVFHSTGLEALSLGTGHYCVA